ncbi:unnamed protein product [Sphagnum balticum]
MDSFLSLQGLHNGQQPAAPAEQAAASSNTSSSATTPNTLVSSAQSSSTQRPVGVQRICRHCVVRRSMRKRPACCRCRANANCTESAMEPELTVS